MSNSSRQLNIARFTRPNSNAPKFASSTRHNSCLCVYCGDYFSPLGYAIHIESHQLNPNAQSVIKAKPGRVKLRDAGPPSVPTDNGRTSDTAGSQDPQQDAQPSGTDDADVAPSGDSGFDLEGDDGVAAARASSSASESVEIVEIYDDNSGDEEEPRCGDKRKRTGVSKPPPLKAHEIKLVLKEWKTRRPRHLQMASHHQRGLY